VGTSPSFATTNLSGKLLFVANQGSNTISVFGVNADGTLQTIGGSPFPAGAIASPSGIANIN